MNLLETFQLMRDIRTAEKDTSTPIGAAKSLRNFLGRDGIATIGECLPDGRFAIYAQSETKEIPAEWCGFPVVNTKEKHDKV